MSNRKAIWTHQAAIESVIHISRRPTSDREWEDLILFMKGQPKRGDFDTVPEAAAEYLAEYGGAEDKALIGHMYSRGFADGGRFAVSHEGHFRAESINPDEPFTEMEAELIFYSGRLLARNLLRSYGTPEWPDTEMREETLENEMRLLFNDSDRVTAFIDGFVDGVIHFSKTGVQAHYLSRLSFLLVEDMEDDIKKASS